MDQIPLALGAPEEQHPPFDVCQFSQEALFSALSNKRCPPSMVAENKRALYLNEYLRDLGASTIIVEAEYTDRDYLDDFASYYVRCFQNYNRRCKRLHFFAISINREEFLKIIRGESRGDDLAQSYLGFIVARPLPVAIIGRTILKTYPPDGG